MSTKFEPLGLYIANVHSSKLLCLVIVLATLTGVGSLYLISKTVNAAIIFMPIVLWQGYRLLLQEGLRIAKKSIVTISQHKDSLWRLAQRDGKEIYARDLGASVRSPFITVLTLKTLPLNKIIRIVLPFDAMSKEQFQVLTGRLWK